MGWIALRSGADARTRVGETTAVSSGGGGSDRQVRPRATAAGTKAHSLPSRILLATSWRHTRRPALPATLLPAARHQSQVAKERLQQQPQPPRPLRRYVPAAAEASRTSPEAWAPPLPLLAAPSSALRFRFAQTVPLVWPFAGSEGDGVRGDARDVHGRCARTLGCACMRRSSFLCTLLPMARRTRPHMRALMHHSPSLAATLKRCCMCFPCADSSYFVALATCRQRPKASAASTQAYRVASSRSCIDLGRSAHVRTAVDPAQRAVGHGTLRSKGAQSKAEMRSIRDPLVTESTGLVGLCGSARVLLRTEESWLLRVGSRAPRNRAVLFLYAFEARSPRLPGTSSHPLVRTRRCRCTRAPLRTPSTPNPPEYL